MNQRSIEPTIPDNIDKGLDCEDQVFSAFNQDGSYSRSDLDGPIKAIDDEEQVAIRALDPPRVRERPNGLVLFRAGVGH